MFNSVQLLKVIPSRNRVKVVINFHSGSRYPKVVPLKHKIKGQD